MKIEFVVGCYNKPYHLITALGSILTQTCPDWTAHVISDGPFDGFDMVKKIYDHDNRFRFSICGGPNADWGHTPKVWGRDQCTEELMVWGSDDNYYCPNFVEEVLLAFKHQPATNFVHVDMLHNHFNYTYFNTYPRIAKIDMGGYVTRTNLAKQIQFNLKSPTGDGEFAEAYVGRFGTEPNSITHIPKALFVHN